MSTETKSAEKILHRVEKISSDLEALEIELNEEAARGYDCKLRHAPR